MITFLSDYGHVDEFVGVCHGVIARRCPQARVIDITHGIPAYDIRAGALALAAALRFMPPAVHLAVVDPGVGARGPYERVAVAVRAGADGTLLVGPNNGVLSGAVRWLGEPVTAAAIGASRYCLEPRSPTFHGRDVFAPVAAALAGGAQLEDVGEPFPASLLSGLDQRHAYVDARTGAIVAHVLTVDGYGNLALNVTAEQLAGARLGAGALALVFALDEPGGHTGRSLQADVATTFADAPLGGGLLYRDSRDMMALAVNQGSAAAWLEVAAGDDLFISAIDRIQL